jgi:ribonucleoside-triphosphate reductase (formate)
MCQIVINSNGFQSPFDKSKIIKNLLSETSISPDAAALAARSVERKVDIMEHETQLRGGNGDFFLTGPLVRGLTCDYLMRHELWDAYKEYKRVGLPIAEVKRIWSVQGDSVKENANIDASNPEGIHKHVADALSKEAVLALLPSHLARKHNSGSLHIHDLEYFYTRQFCFDSDLRYFLRYGLYPDGKGANMPVAGPAMNAEVAVLHAAKALGCMQCMCAGGQGFQNFLTFLSPYMEGKNYKEIKQLAQMFIYEMSQMMVARGAQAVFSSIQLTPGVPKIWKDKLAVYKGKVGPRKYGDFEREVRIAFQAFMDVFEHGDVFGKPFAFPKPEVVLSRDFLGENYDVPYYLDNELGKNNEVSAPSYKQLYHNAFRVIAKHGSIYLENQLHSKDGIIECVQCCAYTWKKDQNDKDFNKQLTFEDGNHFSLGSMQVVTLNLPRAAYIGKDLPGTITELKKLVDACVEIFQIKKEAIGKQPLHFARQTPEHSPPFADIDGLSYVVGIVGLNECVQHLTGEQLHESPEVWKLGIRLMTELEIYVQEKAKESGLILALARTPAETTAQRFAVADLLDTRYNEFATKLVKGNLEESLKDLHTKRDLPVEYSNGSHLAVAAPVYLSERIKLEEPFFPIFGGGNIFHIFLRDLEPYFDTTDSQPVFDESGKHVGYKRVPVCESPAFDMMVDVLQERMLDIASKTQLGYIKISKDSTVCLDCHAIRSGLFDDCRNCGSKNVTQLALITGYVGAVKGFNAAKQQEVKDRHRYDISEVMG